jgi:hypothetical protein
LVAVLFFSRARRFVLLFASSLLLAAALAPRRPVGRVSQQKRGVGRWNGQRRWCWGSGVLQRRWWKAEEVAQMARMESEGGGVGLVVVVVVLTPNPFLRSFLKCLSFDFSLCILSLETVCILSLETVNKDFSVFHYLLEVSEVSLQTRASVSSSSSGRGGEPSQFEFRFLYSFI